MGQFKVLLCSDQPGYSQSLAVAFNENFIFRVIASVEREKLLDEVVRLQPDVAVIKINSLSAIDMLNELKNRCPMLLPVVIVDDPDQYDIMESINQGVRGVLPFRLLPRQIVNAVELITVAGLLCLPRISTRSTNNSSMGNERSAEIIAALTVREREVLSLLGRSYSNQEIAETLCLSESTVKTHLRNVFHKLRVRNRSEAIALLYGTDLMRYEQLA
ncbi:MAG: response regulator transcription factor [Syntrophomonas sp.]